jgi:hypothetical protein
MKKAPITEIMLMPMTSAVCKLALRELPLSAKIVLE